LGSNASVKAYISYMREYSLLWHNIAQGIDLLIISDYLLRSLTVAFDQRLQRFLDSMVE